MSWRILLWPTMQRNIQAYVALLELWNSNRCTQAAGSYQVTFIRLLFLGRVWLT